MGWNKKGKNKDLKKTTKGTTRKILKNNKYTKYTNKEIAYTTTNHEKRISKIESTNQADKIIYSVFTPPYRINFNDGIAETYPYISPLLLNANMTTGIYDNTELFQAFDINSSLVIPNMDNTVNSGESLIPLIVDTRQSFIGKHFFNIKLNWRWTEQWQAANLGYANSELVNKVRIKAYVVFTHVVTLTGIQAQCKVLPLAGECTYKRQVFRLNEGVAINNQPFDKHKNQARVLWSQEFVLNPRTVTVYKQSVPGVLPGSSVESPTYRYREIHLNIRRQIQLNKIQKFMEDYSLVNNKHADNYRIYFVLKYEDNAQYDIIHRIDDPQVDPPNIKINYNLVSNIMSKL